MQEVWNFGCRDELVRIGVGMRVLLTSAGLETQEIQERFVKLINKDISSVKALFIPTAAIDAEAIMVLPKCINDLLKCGIQNRNICVYDMHWGMNYDELNCYDVVYLCGGNTQYLLQRMNKTGFHKVLKKYIQADGVVLGVSAGSIIFTNNLPENLGLLDVKLHVHCENGEKSGKLEFLSKDEIYLTNTQALIISDFSDGLEIIGE